MNILVTGGAGFIGSHTVDALLQKGHKIKILDNFSKPVHAKGRPSYIPYEAELIEGDVRCKESWLKALKGIEVVYHFAAYQDYLTDFSTFYHVNDVGTSLLYEVIVEQKLSIKKIILSSSQAVYGEGRYRCLGNEHIVYPDLRQKDQLDKGQWNHFCPACGELLSPMFTDEKIVKPQNQYAISKYVQELISMNLGKQYGIPTTILRYSIVQGPRQSLYNAYSGACRIFCLSYYYKKAPTIYEDGLQLRDFVNIKDVIDANLLVLEKEESNFEIYNVGGGRRYLLRKFANIVKKIYNSTVEPVISNEYRLGDTRHISSDISKLKALGWGPKRSVEESVLNYSIWLNSQVDKDKEILLSANSMMKNLGVVCQVKV